MQLGCIDRPEHLWSLNDLVTNETQEQDLYNRQHGIILQYYIFNSSGTVVQLGACQQEPAAC